ncbi:type I methionyl aminopeptidase [Clostridium folliculivorans]|uniref:Methionine aminopeptidase n=1 Tax=Clostridium folliculivorans TaxID=2886038 RepID=A0A9W6DAJ4_9CLOT|nr:type I methionyl aminopeptidase [Clostridium folliculivorans]GKU24887.1 methionine aminopeptidase [Clostridium folliculivorans]GKU30985.1 methionine aminopeptidase [Clostridium folliculivorans]
MIINSESELEALRRIGKIVAEAREEILKAVRPGISTIELDLIGEKILSSYGAKSAPKYEYNFPGATCISINDEAAHGIPSTRLINEGDSVNIDVSAVLDGYFSDTGATIVVSPNANNIKQKLCDCSKQALDKAIMKAKAGSKINQIGRTIFNEARRNGFTVIRDLTGHGIGKNLHEDPENILNYFDINDSCILTDGLVLAVETFISTGAEHIFQDTNGWTYKTPDKSIVAQFEHTIVVTKGKPIILTTI